MIQICMCLTAILYSVNYSSRQEVCNQNDNSSAIASNLARTKRENGKRRRRRLKMGRRLVAVLLILRLKLMRKRAKR